MPYVVSIDFWQYKVEVDILMAEKRIVCFQSKKVKICLLFLTTIIYI